MDELTTIKEKLQEEIPSPEVYLYGSRARGDFYPDSDYDIAVVSPGFEGMTQNERYNHVSPTIRSVLEGKPVDIVCYTPDEFEDGKEGFLPELIEKEGVKA